MTRARRTLTTGFGTIALLMTLAATGTLLDTANAAEATGNSDGAPAVADIPISFTVTNTNRSKVSCRTDGKTYTIRGHLTGPAAAITGTDIDGGALYLHGLEVGEEFWRMPVEGDGFVQQLAARGHVSVTINRVGYNDSGASSGFNSCVGGHADIAHQIIGQLKAGTYSGDHHPQFEKVALLGHSLGGAITEIEAYSFNDADAIGILSFADSALTPSVLAGSLSWGLSCTLGGARSEAGAPGYAYLTSSTADYRRNFLAHTPAPLLPQALALRELNPCADMTSAVAAVPVNLLSIGRIRVPTLVMSGTDDLVFDINRVRLQSYLFTGTPSLTLRVVPGATHGFTLEPTAATFINETDGWLRATGF